MQAGVAKQNSLLFTDGEVIIRNHAESLIKGWLFHFESGINDVFVINLESEFHKALINA